MIKGRGEKKEEKLAKSRDSAGDKCPGGFVGSN